MRWFIVNIKFLLFLTVLIIIKKCLYYGGNSKSFSQGKRPAVLVVVNNLKEMDNFALAQNTLKCYCKIFNYRYINIVLDTFPDLAIKCPQKDIMFRRHCVTINILLQNPEIPYLLFLDADFGVINPRHLIESYIDPHYDIIFYERIFSPEIAAGSYIIKNTPYAINFLRDWVDYEPKMPQSFNGRDNSALHQIFVDRFASTHPKIPLCQQIWNESKNWEDVKKFVSCARSIVNSTLIFDRIKIISKNLRTSWARDGWLTNSEWGPNDFFVHGWKETKRNIPGFGKWNSPFQNGTNFQMSLCNLELSDPFINWCYDQQFIKSEEEIKNRISLISKNVQKQYEFNFTQY